MGNKEGKGIPVMQDHHDSDFDIHILLLTNFDVDHIDFPLISENTDLQAGIWSGRVISLF